jgi:hypothetical protein
MIRSVLSLILLAGLFVGAAEAEDVKVQELKPSKESGLAAAYNREYAF